VALLWFIAGTAASAQTGPGVGYDPSLGANTLATVKIVGRYGRSK